MKKKTPDPRFTMKYIMTWIILSILLIIISYKIYTLLCSFEAGKEDCEYC